MSSHRLAVIAALPRELSRLLAQLGERRTTSSGAIEGLLAGVPVTCVATGPGEERARAATQRLLESSPVDAIIAIGFGGGLDPSARPGDVIVGREIVRATSAEPGDTTAPVEPARSDPRLLDLARGCAIPGVALREGRLVTTPAVVHDAGAKLELGRRWEASAVDNESAGIAEASAVTAVPTLFLRAIVDDVGFPLPAGLELTLDSAGRPRPLAILRRLVRRPGEIVRLVRLGRRSRIAASALAALVERIAQRYELDGEGSSGSAVAP